MSLEINPFIRGTLEVVREKAESGTSKARTLRTIRDFIDLSHLSQLTTTHAIIRILSQGIRVEEKDGKRLARDLRHTNVYLRTHKQYLDPWAEGQIASVLTTRMDEVGRSLDHEEETQAMGPYTYVLHTIEGYNPRLRRPQRTLAFLEFLDMNGSLVTLRSALRGEARQLRRN